MRTFLSRLALVLASVVTALLLAEGVYRLSLLVTTDYRVAATGSQYEFYQFDPVLGWANTPGAHGTFRRQEFSYSVRINKDGLRHRAEIPRRRPYKRRIAVLGDSFTWGIGVSDHERFTELLDAQLPGTDVVNFGVSGYSPVQILPAA